MEIESAMKPNTSQSTWEMPIGLGVQLLVSHGVAAWIAINVARSMGIMIALVSAGVLSMALTFTLQRTLWLINTALDRLKDPQQPPTELAMRWHGPLTGLVAAINTLLAREREVYDLRESLLTQARDTAAQQERNRLARNLHDSIKQQIFSISMSAAAAQARWDTDPQGAQEALGDVQRGTGEAMVEMTALLQQLSPAPLEKIGLVQALRDQCEALGYRADVQVVTEFGELPPDDRLPPGAQESIFRIAQEALSNIARHARADHAHLHLDQAGPDGPLTLEIQDDGQGFEIEAAEGGMGLENIQQRALALGGELTINSAPGNGTRLRVTIPLAQPVVPQEDTMDKQDHTLNKVFLVGLGGGLALIAALFYPLYVLVPGRYVESWLTGSEAVGLVLETLAAALVVAVGFLAARWSKAATRGRSTLFGALAGGVAGAVLYYGIGAPTASVVGGSPVLLQGPVPIPEKAVLIYLLSESVVGIVWWSHAAFWAALLVGAGLGAMGGLLAPPVAETPRDPDLRSTAQAILTAAAMVGALAILNAIAMFGLIEPTIREGMLRNGVSLETSLPLAGVSGWLIGTPMFLYVVSLAVLYLLVRGEIRTAKDPAQLEAAQTRAGLLSLVCFGLPVYLGTIGTPRLQARMVTPRGWMDITGLFHPSPLLSVTAVSGLLVLGLVGSLILGGLYLTALNAAYRRGRNLGISLPHPILSVTVIIILLIPGLMGWAIRLGYSHSLVLQCLSGLVGLAIIVAAIVVIASLLRVSKGSPPYIVKLSRFRSSIPQSINAGLGSVIAMVIPVMTIISFVVGLGLITNQLSEALMGYQFAVQEFTMVELVSDVYLAQARAFIVSFVATTAIIGLLTLIITGIAALPEQLSAQNAEAVQSGRS